VEQEPVTKDRLEDMTNTKTEAKADEQITRVGRGIMTEPEGQKVPRERPAPLKDVKYEGRSGNVYENKGPYDSLPDKKDDISARLHAILHQNTRIFAEPSALLPVFERN